MYYELNVSYNNQKQNKSEISNKTCQQRSRFVII